MAKLNDFIGAIVSGISDARVNSDLNSLQIAQNYAQNDLLKHFAVPRMRVDKVEVNIPIAINGVTERTQKVYEPIKNDTFVARTYEIVQNLIGFEKYPSAALTFKTYLYEQVQFLATDLKLKGNETALENFANRVAVRSTTLLNEVSTAEQRAAISTDEMISYNAKIAEAVRLALSDQLIQVSETTVYDDVDFIVEAEKLRDIKPENVLLIKMSLIEQGMEWITMENSKGEIVSKLMPE
jgi:hypothetical protein